VILENPTEYSAGTAVTTRNAPSVADATAAASKSVQVTKTNRFKLGPTRAFLEEHRVEHQLPRMIEDSSTFFDWLAMEVPVTVQSLASRVA
jgi:hypothetical protein